MIESKFFDYEKYRKIRNLSNREVFKNYLTVIFKSLSIYIDQDIKIIPKVIFSQYIGLPYFISTNIYKILCHKNHFLTIDRFIVGMTKLYNGSLEDSIEFTFKLLDLNCDGYISPSDAKLILNFLISKTNDNSIDLEILISVFFDSDLMDFKNYIKRIKKIDSNIYFIIYYYILQQAPFDENGLEVIKSNYTSSSYNCDKSDYFLKTTYRSIVKPCVKVSNFLSIDIENIELIEDEDEEILKEMNKMETEIFIHRLNTKMISNLNNAQVKIKENSFRDHISNIFNGSLYILKKKIKKLKRFNVIFINRDLFFLNDKKFIKLYNLTDCYIDDEIKKYKYENFYLFSFSINLRGKIIHLYFRDIIESKKFINQFKKNLNIRNINDDYIIMNKIGKGSFGE